MKNIAVLNGITLSAFSQEKLPGGKNAFECALEFAKNLPDVRAIRVLLTAPRKESEGCDVSIQKEWNAASVLEQITAASKGFDNIFYFYADTPLLDPVLAGKMYDNHIKYFAEYTFADGFPLGLAAEIVKPHIMEPLSKLCKPEDPVARDMFFEIIKRDINSFDLETELSASDLRILRLCLSADTKGNTEILKRVMESGAESQAEVMDLVQKKPEILRAYPAYYQLQIVEGCPQSCSYCPYPKVLPDVIGKKNEMKAAQVIEFAKKALDFSGECAISLSLWGEPALHSQIIELITKLQGMDGLDLVIETSGLGWDSDAVKKMAGQLSRSPLWIVSLDSPEPALYKTLRGDGFQEAVAFARTLAGLFPGKVHVQAVRMNENEEQLERFYREWKKEMDTVIVQKYDSFAGFLPDRKVTDLSPLNRFPCWHNKREMTVLLDGSVPLCREDLKKENLLGNVFKDSLEKIWENGSATYLSHIALNYPGICKGCDEYYTFNF